MDRTEFEAALRAQGYGEVVDRRMEANALNPEHAHEFDARLLVLEGAGGPYVKLPGEGGAPARLVRPREEEFKKERNRILDLLTPPGGGSPFG